jgi:hypothetical protein
MVGASGEGWDEVERAVWQRDERDRERYMMGVVRGMQRGGD